MHDLDDLLDSIRVWLRGLDGRYKETLMRALGGLLSILVIVLRFSGAADAGNVMKHSGSIASFADDERSFVLSEIGPWQMGSGATGTIHRTIALTPETEFSIVARADGAPSGFPGDFVEMRMGVASVFLNDYVTVECRHEGGRQVALKVTVVYVPPAATERPLTHEPGRPWEAP
jgi:hypothetical protein